MKKPLICIHGLQGSGKTYLTKKIEELILEPKEIIPKYVNIKSTFMPIVDMVQDYYAELGYPLDEAQRKQLMLAQSTYGEMYIDTKIWTKIWTTKTNKYPSDVILVDDIRTEYNLNGLLALDRPVVLFKLDVSEEVRKSRLGDKWRNNGGYTEKLLTRPEELPSEFEWIELKESWDMEVVQKAIGKYL